MGIKTIKDGMEKGSVCFGVKQALKNLGKKKSVTIFVVKDISDRNLNLLEEKEAELEFLKTRDEVAKELGLDFKCEVFSVI